MQINSIPVQDETHIRTVLARVMAGSEEFAVLDRDERHFLQTDGYGLEYKNPAGLYRAAKEEFTQEELEEVLTNEKQPIAYIGYEPSGKIHLGHAITVLKMIALQKAGFHIKMLLADYHAFLNGKGELVGIIVAKSAGEDIEGIGFAIPINDVKEDIAELKVYGYKRGRVQLGVTLIDISFI